MRQQEGENYVFRFRHSSSIQIRLQQLRLTLVLQPLPPPGPSGYRGIPGQRIFPIHAAVPARHAKENRAPRDGGARRQGTFTYLAGRWLFLPPPGIRGQASQAAAQEQERAGEGGDALDGAVATGTGGPHEQKDIG